MCDCYSTVCSCCGRVMSIHVGDFSTGRTNIDVFCWRPQCRQALLAVLTGTEKSNWRSFPLAPHSKAEYDTGMRYRASKKEKPCFSGLEKMVFASPCIVGKHHEDDKKNKYKNVVFLVDIPHGINMNE